MSSPYNVYPSGAYDPRYGQYANGGQSGSVPLTLEQRVAALEAGGGGSGGGATGLTPTSVFASGSHTPASGEMALYNPSSNISGSLPVAAAGQRFGIGNVGSAQATFTRQGSDAFSDGATSVVLAPGERVVVLGRAGGFTVESRTQMFRLAGAVDVDQTGAATGKVPAVVGTNPTAYGLGWPDLAEAASVRTAVEATPANLLGRINRFDATTAGAVLVQPLPPAVPGAVVGIGLDAGPGIQYVADGTDKIGSGAGAASETVTVVSARTLHCTTLGRWRVRSGFVSPAVLDALYMRKTINPVAAAIVFGG